jgi:F0F1-type ATP synthase membrane subunit c/vacuolar-type H+-ATPase subunit K
MFSPVWLFVVAAIIAVFGIIFAFKKMAGGIETKLENNEPLNQGSLQKEFTRFFITIAIVEVIPILLLVLGFAQMEGLFTQTTNQGIMLPLSLVFLTLLFGIGNVLLTRSRLLNDHDPSNESRNMINTITFIGMGMVSSIPIVSIVALLPLLG